MIYSQIVYLLIGLLFGTTLLAIGLALGVWISRKNEPDEAAAAAAPEAEAPKFEPNQFVSLVRDIADSTSHLAGDVLKYQTRMHQLVEMARGMNGKDTDEIRPILDQIMVANNQMQARLDAAEKKLEQQHAQLQDYLTEARTDALTGLPNRRSFDQALNDLYAKHLRTQQPLTVALVDVDYFKKVNDTYGHAAGDVVLKRVADHLAAHAKDCHLAARYGGEEFALIFAGPREEAATLSERIRAAIAADTVHAEGHTIRVTISVGISQIANGQRLGDLIRHSDQALYSAKESGRNRVVLFENMTPASLAGPAVMKTATPAHCVAGSSAPAASHEPGAPGTGATAETSVGDGLTGSASGIEAIEKRLVEHLDRIVREESGR